MEFIVKQKQEMRDVARTALSAVLGLTQREGEQGAVVIGLSGELGAGKTTFTQALAQELCVKDSVNSPTFVIARFYPLSDNQRFLRLVHIDAYRIEDESELAPIGWEKIIADPQNLVVVEWPEKLGTQMPKETHTLFFEVIDEQTRKISMSLTQ